MNEAFDKYNILLTPSSVMFKPTLVVMLSAMINCNLRCNFYIMNPDWTDEQKSICSRLISTYSGNEVNFIDVTDQSKFHIFKSWKGYYTLFYKLLAHEHLPDSVERILYLDTDTIVRKDIYKYYSTDFEDNYLVCAHSLMEIHPSIKNEEWNKITVFERHKQSATVSNPGVLLINIAKFKREHIDANFYNNHIKQLPDNNYWFEEGLLNYIFWDKRKFVPAYKYQTMLGFVKNYKDVYKYSKEERKVKFNEMYQEDFSLEEELSIIHFVCVKNVGKPWECIYKPESGNIFSSTEERVKPEFEPFYVEWWKIASKLPKELYEELYLQAIQHCSILPVKRELSWMTNAKNFFEHLALDCLTNHRFNNFLSSIQNKKISILKAFDSAGRFIMQNLESTKTDIVFKSGKAYLRELTDEEWSVCKTADIIICCCIHGTVPEERDGIKPIMTKDILDDTSWDTEVSNYKGENVLPQISSPNEKMSGQITELFARLDEYKSSFDNLHSDNKALNEQIACLTKSEAAFNSTINTLEKNINALSEQNTHLSSNLSEMSVNLASAYKQAKELEIERNDLQKTILDLNDQVAYLTKSEEALKTLETKVSTLSEQNEHLSANLGEASSNIASTNQRVKELEIERDSLQHTISEMENSRSWRYTKMFRKK